jgi:hypothetical protein
MPDMNEDAARDVLLVRAIETADVREQILSGDDRRHATRTAAELARWDASAHGRPPSPELFLARRAELLIKRIAEEQPAIARSARALAWRPWIAALIPLAAFIAGLAVEHIADRQRVNILAFPLFGIVAWNLVVYLLLALHGLRVFGRAQPGGLRRWIAAIAQRALRAPSDRMASALSAFGAEWSKLIAPLTAARVARVLHLAAALLAAGAIAGMYLRGLVFDYRAGWESTFLDAPAVHAVLSFFLSPAANLLGMPFPTVDEIAALRFGTTTGESAARWIHWYAITVGAVVIVPRLVLWLVAVLRERWLAHRLPVDLEAPYFRRLIGPFARGAVRLRVVPYSYSVDETSIAGLRAIAQRLLGDDAELMLTPPVAYGDEQGAGRGIVPADAQAPLTIALFSLAATPESENHGAFVAALRSAVARGSRCAAIVDESGYRRRLGAQAADRIAERRQAWQAFGAAQGLALACIDLETPDLGQAERALEPALATSE